MESGFFPFRGVSARVFETMQRMVAWPSLARGPAWRVPLRGGMLESGRLPVHQKSVSAISAIEAEAAPAQQLLRALDPETDEPHTYSVSSSHAQLTQRQIVIISWITPLAILAIWEAAARGGFVEPHILPAPSKVFLTAVKLTFSGSLLNDLGVSLRRAAMGFAVGGSAGFVLGALVGFSRLGEAVIDRTIQMIRAVPFLAALPLVIVWFGVGEAEKIFLVALGVAFPIYINTTLGIKQVDPKLIELGCAQGLRA
jgi:sulfonate transport system permease protein